MERDYKRREIAYLKYFSTKRALQTPHRGMLEKFKDEGDAFSR